MKTWLELAQARYRRMESHLLERAQTYLAEVPAWRIGIGVWLLSSFLACPLFYRWNWPSLMATRASDYLLRCDDPFARNLTEPILAYRLTLPVIAWGLHLPKWASLALPFLVSIAFLAVVFALMRRRTDGVTAGLSTVLLSLSWGFFQTNWMPAEFTDTVSHLCAVVMLFSSSPIVIVLATVLGLFNDERMILALPFILFWHHPPSWRASWFKSSARWALSATGAIAIYFALRHALTVGWIGPGIPLPAVYNDIDRSLSALDPYIGSWAAWGGNVLAAFRWAWLVVIVYVAWLLRHSRWGGALHFSAVLIVGSFLSLTVLDIGRSVAFMLPAWLLAIRDLHADDQARSQRFLLRIVIALLITPVFSFDETNQVMWYSSMPHTLWNAFVGR